MSTSTNKESLPYPVVHRLPRYYRYLLELQNNGVERISSGELAKMMSLTASQVRQDFSSFGRLGQQGYGYSVEKLRQEFCLVLGISDERSIILIGAGHLGNAIAHNFSFDQYGFKLTAAFDISKEIIGKELVNGVRIYGMDKLGDFIKCKKTDAALLTLTQSHAQEVADRLITYGVKNLWNFTNTELYLNDKNAVVENVHFGDSLLVFSYRISGKE